VRFTEIEQYFWNSEPSRIKKALENTLSFPGRSEKPVKAQKKGCTKFAPQFGAA